MSALPKARGRAPPKHVAAQAQLPEGCATAARKHLSAYPTSAAPRSVSARCRRRCACHIHAAGVKNAARASVCGLL